MRNIVAVLCILLLTCTSAFAAPTPSRGGADRQTIQTALERHDVAAGLTAAGYAPERVQEVLDRLSPADLHQLATNVQQLQAAGAMQGKTWIAIGMVVLFVVLLSTLEDDDNQQMSRSR